MAGGLSCLLNERSAEFVQRYVPLAVLALGLLVTAAFSVLLWRVAEARDLQRFQHAVDLRTKTVDDHLGSYLGLLRSTAGLYAASRNAISRQDFRRFADSVGLRENFPGLYGLGFARRVLPEETPAQLEALMRTQGATNFAIYPRREGNDAVPIVLIEPEGENRTALGYDMFEEAVRRKAMETARDTGTPAITGRVRLVQELDHTVKQPGFLIYVPVYRGERAPRTLGERRNWLLGYVFSPFRAHDLFGTMFPARLDDAVGLEIYAGEIAPHNLLFRTEGDAGAANGDGGASDVSEIPEAYRQETVRMLPIAGGVWRLRYYSLPSFHVDSTLPAVWYVATCGLLATLLLTYASARESRARAAERHAAKEVLLLNRHLEQRVAVRTADLEEATTRLMRESEERQQVEDQLRQAQRIEAVGQLTSGVAHDFNNLLTVIAGNLDLLRKPLAQDERSLKRLQHMREAADRGARLTQQLLAFSRKQRLTPRPVDVAALVQGMVPLLQTTLSKSTRIELRETPDLWPAMADPTQLELMILNLAINARDAMDGDGNILTVSAANVVTGAPARPEEPPPGPFVMVSVSDTGSGMSEEVLAKAFEPFFTTKAGGKGSGLGLSQVFGVAKQMGGGVRIDSRAGEGTTVRVYMPRADVAAEAERQPARARRPVTAGAHVLVVDDEDAVRAVTAAILSEAGYKVTDLPGGAAALSAVLQGMRFDAAVLDYAMPDMNGLQLSQRLGEHRPHMPVLFVTGYADFEAMATQVEDDRILRKPFEPQDLIDRLEAMMEHAPAA